MVDKVDFQPDILSRAGHEIIERLNARGKVLEDSLKSVCLHRKGLEVEVSCIYFRLSYMSDMIRSLRVIQLRTCLQPDFYPLVIYLKNVIQ